MLTEISGEFVKIVAAGEDGQSHLRRGLANRPPARFNRKGQDALYLSPDAESARVAIGQYVVPDDPTRVLITYVVSQCALVDLRHPEAAAVYDRARRPWQSELARGRTPAPWRAADALREAGHLGLIDPSRRRAGLWAITLFRWNEPGAPSVQMIGTPRPIDVSPGYR